MYTQVTVINDALNLLRGKLVRFILEDGDMRTIANLVQAADLLGLEYDQEAMVYRLPHTKPKPEPEVKRKRGRPRKAK